MKIKLLLFLSLITFTGYSQVKIGNNPSVIDSNSLLELESVNKVLVITKMSTVIMNNTQPLQGALVYNTDENCIYTYNGSGWLSLCDDSIGSQVTTTNIAPINNNIGDFWINDGLNNTVSIWDGVQWVTVDTNPLRGNGIPNSTSIPNALAGDAYVDQTTGLIYGFDGTNWVPASSSVSITANNGVSISGGNNIELGGSLIQPTSIVTDNANTLSIEGLENISSPENNDIVIVDQNTGKLSKINTGNILREEITEITAANNGQLQFNLTLFTDDKVNVFRNGVRIGFTIINNNTIEVEPEAICFQGDEIRVVQLY